MSRKEREVWQACDDLLALGKTPREVTGEAIGNRLRELSLKPGSLTYRYRYRDSWMEERGLTRESLEEATKSSDIIDRSAAIFRKTIEESIREEYEIKYQEAKKEVIDANQRYEECHQALGEMTKTKEELKKELIIAQEEVLKFKQQFTQEREKRIQFEERMSFAEQRCEQQKLNFEEQIKQLKSSHADALKVLQTMSTTAQSQYQREIEELRTLMESQRHQWIVENDALKVGKAKLERQLDKTLLLEQKTQEKIAEMAQLIQRLEVELKSTKTRCEALETKDRLQLQALAILQSEHSTLKSTLEKEESHREELKSLLRVEQEQVGRFEKQFSTILIEIAELKNQDKRKKVKA